MLQDAPVQKGVWQQCCLAAPLAVGLPRSTKQEALGAQGVCLESAEAVGSAQVLFTRRQRPSRRQACRRTRAQRFAGKALSRLSLLTLPLDKITIPAAGAWERGPATLRLEITGLDKRACQRFVWTNTDSGPRRLR